jgi:hypothetical protein
LYHITSVLCAVTPPDKFVVVSSGWPSSLILVIALGLPLQAAYFPNKFHAYFNCSKAHVTKWDSVVNFWVCAANVGVIYLLSGDIQFLRHMLVVVAGYPRVIVTVDVGRRRVSRQALLRASKAGHALFEEFDLKTLVIGDAASGGATDAQHLMGFWRDLGSVNPPPIEPGLPRTVRHVLDGGVEGPFPTVLKNTLPVLVNPA